MYVQSTVKYIYMIKNNSARVFVSGLDPDSNKHTFNTNYKPLLYRRNNTLHVGCLYKM